MAIEGSYNLVREGDYAPFIQAFVHLPRLGLREWITFLLDTGADGTCLHPRDVAQIGIGSSQMLGSASVTATGVGGSFSYHWEPSWLMFRESARGFVFCQIELAICEFTDDPDIGNLPSLLGRDFLNRCRISLDSEMNFVQLEPRNISDWLILP